MNVTSWNSKVYRYACTVKHDVTVVQEHHEIRKKDLRSLWARWHCSVQSIAGAIDVLDYVWNLWLDHDALEHFSSAFTAWYPSLVTLGRKLIWSLQQDISCKHLKSYNHQKDGDLWALVHEGLLKRGPHSVNIFKVKAMPFGKSVPLRNSSIIKSTKTARTSLLPMRTNFAKVIVWPAYLSIMKSGLISIPIWSSSCSASLYEYTWPSIPCASQMLSHWPRRVGLGIPASLHKSFSVLRVVRHVYAMQPSMTSIGISGGIPSAEGLHDPFAGDSCQLVWAMSAMHGFNFAFSHLLLCQILRPLPWKGLTETAITCVGFLTKTFRRQILPFLPLIVRMSADYSLRQGTLQTDVSRMDLRKGGHTPVCWLRYMVSLFLQSTWFWEASAHRS